MAGSQQKKYHMSSENSSKPYDVAEHEGTGSLNIVAFGEIVPNTPTFTPDEIEEARNFCDVLNTAYNAGASGKGNVSASTDAGYNTMTRSGP